MKGKLSLNEVNLTAFKDATAKSYDAYIDSYGNEYLTFVRETAAN